MAKINVLDQDTINKIAAGEVVERPASVVKELVENSIDAKATAVSVSILGGGATQIRVTDNGSGFETDDLELAFLKNTTSKIRCAEDLCSVTSLGFRGEALSSIAAVSKLELLTKTRDELLGTRYCIHGGVKQEQSEVGCPDGTTFVVNDLFYNTPVRRKFLKSAMTEAGYVNDVMERIALSNPKVAIKFTNNGKLIINTSGNGKLRDVIYGIYGREIASELCEVSKSINGFSLSGMVAKPVIARGNRNYENYFLNGRYIKNPLISKAIEEAYRGYLMQNKYPFTVLMLRLPNELFDVNVHPAKLEVRFTQPELIYEFVYSFVRSTIVGKETIPKATLEEAPPKSQQKEIPREYAPEPFERENKSVKPTENQIPKLNITPESMSCTAPESMPCTAPESMPRTVPESMPRTVPESMPNTDAIVGEPSGLYLNSDTDQLSFLSEEAKKEHRIIGQVFSTYWLVEYDEKLYIIDQHAAHERILYEELQNAHKQGIPNAQQLFPPIIISLNLREQETLEQYIPYLERLGFELESFGGREYKISAVPADLPSIDRRDFLIDFLDGLSENGIPTEPEAIYEKIASMSCKAAVKGNQKLSYEEARTLIQRLMKLENPFHCPHGRPITIELEKRELEKKFKRIVS